jgi:hypothetical protein
MPYLCITCDGDEVEVQSWVNPNTGMEGEDGEVNTSTTWCKTCVESDLGIVWKDDFLKERLTVIHITDNDNNIKQN